jgi:hypothetical protein
MQSDCFLNIHPTCILRLLQCIAEALPQLDGITFVLLLELRQLAINRGVIVYDLDLVFRSISLLFDEREGTCKLGWKVLGIGQEVGEGGLDVRIRRCSREGAEGVRECRRHGCILGDELSSHVGTHEGRRER